MTGGAPGTAGSVLVVLVEGADGAEVPEVPEVPEVDGAVDGCVVPCRVDFPPCPWSWGTVGAATVTGLGEGELLPEREAARAIPAATTKTATAMTAPASHRSPRRSHHGDPASLVRLGVSLAKGASTGPGDAFGRSGGGGAAWPGSSVGRGADVDGSTGGSPADSTHAPHGAFHRTQSAPPGCALGWLGRRYFRHRFSADMFPHCRSSMRAPGPAPGSGSSGGAGWRASAAECQKGHTGVPP